MEEADEAMVARSGGGMPIAVYPPLPSLTDHDLRLQETTTRTAVFQGQGSGTRRQVEAPAQHSAAVQQMTAEQLGQVQRQQDSLAAQTSEYLQGQHDRQSSLLEQQQEMRRQMDEHGQYLDEQYRLLKAAEEAVGLQGQRLESLAEAVQPHLQARWGAFAQGSSPPTDGRPTETHAVTVAAGTNLPVPPIYRGSSKKEKRDFMDSYAIYTRRIKALNQGTQAKFFVMPLSACIEQGTMVRNCGFELLKDEKDATEPEWRDYFLSARVPDNTAYKTLDKEVKSLCMNTNLQDAESRLSRLMADFYEILDRLNMEDVVQVEPKKVVGYLVEALRPQAFRSAVKDQLGRQAHKPIKASIQMFLKWLRQELEGFMRFEAHIASQSSSTYGGKGSQPQTSSSHQKKNNSGSANTSRAPEKSSNSQPKPSNARKGGHDARPKLDKQEKKCFKCGDQTHGVFQCPDIASPVEAKELYEQSTGRKVVKPVLAVTADDQDAVVSSAAIACMVMEAVETSVTPDSAAEVSIITTKFLRALSHKGTWLTHLKIPGKAAVMGIGGKPVPVTSKVKLDLRFNTPGGPLVLRNVICWVTEGSLPAGVGELLLSRWIMQRLGYSPEKLLAAAQQQQSEWDLNDIDDGSTGSVARIMAYSGISKPQQRADEELAMEEDEDRACFPTFVDDADAERELIRSILLEKVEEAQRFGASEEFVEELRRILMQMIDVFRLIIGRDPPVDMPPMEIKLNPGATPVRCRVRRYSQAHRDFLKKQIDELIAAGLCYRNQSSRWCSPPHVVNKQEANAFRMTVDVRGPNGCVEQIVWPMPILEVIFERLRGSSRYFSLDFFKGFWQFAMAVWCQEIYSILTEEGVITCSWEALTALRMCSQQSSKCLQRCLTMAC